MSTHDKASRDLERLVEQLVSGGLDKHAQSRLAEILDGSADARRQYLEVLNTHSLLRAEFGSAGEFDEVEAIERVVGQVSEEIGSLPRPASVARHPARRFSMETRHLAAGVAIGVTFVALSLSIMHQILLPVRVAEKGENRTDKSKKEQPNLESVARLVNDVEAKWEGSVENPVFGRQQRIKTGMRLYPGQKLKLESGLAEFKFFNGAEVVLQGPAEFEVLGKKVCGLSVGRLVARADEERSKGFIVEAPGARFVDLGTRFAVSVERGGRSEVHVAQGAVSVRRVDASGEVVETIEVKKDQAAVVASRTTPIESVDYNVRRLVLIAGGDQIGPRWIHIANPSFELPVLNRGEPWRNRVQGWEATMQKYHGVSAFGSQFADPTPHGRQMLFLNEGTVSQRLTEMLAPDTHYTLTLDAGNRPGRNSPNYTVELVAGSAVLASATSDDVMPAKGRFREVKVEFACDASHPAVGQRLMVVLRANGSLALKTQNHFDAVRLRAEPKIVSEEPEQEENIDKSTH